MVEGIAVEGSGRSYDEVNIYGPSRLALGLTWLTPSSTVRP